MPPQTRSAQDLLSRIQGRLDQLDRNVGLGFALPFTPVVSMSSSAPSQGANTGFWLRHNDLLVMWFTVVIGSTVGSGTLAIGTPGGLMLEGSAAARSNIGAWNGTLATSSAFGWIEPYASVDFSKIILRYQSAYPTGTLASVAHSTPVTMIAGNTIWGHVVAKVADP